MRAVAKAVLRAGLAVTLAACAAACTTLPRSGAAGAQPSPARSTPPPATIAAASAAGWAAMPAPDAQPADRPFTGNATRTAASAQAAVAGPPFAPAGSLVLEPGLYRCESGLRVVVRRIGEGGRAIVIHWADRDYTLAAVPARSGALRFEDVRAGLAWLVIVGKSMLLDSRHGHPLANECRQ